MTPKNLESFFSPQHCGNHRCQLCMHENATSKCLETFKSPDLKVKQEIKIIFKSKLLTAYLLASKGTESFQSRSLITEQFFNGHSTTFFPNFLPAKRRSEVYDDKRWWISAQFSSHLSEIKVLAWTGIANLVKLERSFQHRMFDNSISGFVPVRIIPFHQSIRVCQTWSHSLIFHWLPSAADF